MKTSELAPKDWQEWFDQFLEVYCTRGLADLVAAMGDDDSLSGLNMTTAFVVPVHVTMCTAFMLAYMQKPRDQAEVASASMVKTIAEIRFDKAPRGLKGKIKKKYQSMVQDASRITPPMADLVAEAFKCYANDNYNHTLEINTDIRDANTLLQARRRSEAYQIMGRTGAAILRGAPMWGGWLNESSGEFELWLLALTSMRSALSNVIPLLPYSEQCAHVDSVLAGQTQMFKEVMTDEGSAEGLVISNDEGEYFRQLDEMAKLAVRDEPLSDDEIKELGDSYDLFGRMSAQSLGVIQFAPEDDETSNVLLLFVRVLGILRYPDSRGITQLVMIAAGANERADEEAIDLAAEALEQIGQPAVQHVLDFVRYSSLEDARSDLLEVLGVVGRGSAEVFDYLNKQFSEASWLDDKYDYVKALGLTHDPRAVPLIVEALRDPAVDDDIVWELLDALQELSVTFYINHDSQSVNIPEYGVIENILPPDWQSRKELELAEDDWDEDWEYDGEGDEDEDDDQLDDVVTYDEDGTPRCPDCGAVMHYIDGSWVHEGDVEEPKSAQPKIRSVGRNDPCPCGSGKKYKHCHGRGE